MTFEGEVQKDRPSTLGGACLYTSTPAVPGRARVNWSCLRLSSAARQFRVCTSESDMATEYCNHPPFCYNCGHPTNADDSPCPLFDDTNWRSGLRSGAEPSDEQRALLSVEIDALQAVADAHQKELDKLYTRVAKIQAQIDQRNCFLHCPIRRLPDEVLWRTYRLRNHRQRRSTCRRPARAAPFIEICSPSRMRVVASPRLLSFFPAAMHRMSCTDPDDAYTDRRRRPARGCGARSRAPAISRNACSPHTEKRHLLRWSERADVTLQPMEASGHAESSVGNSTGPCFCPPTATYPRKHIRGADNR